MAAVRPFLVLLFAIIAGYAAAPTAAAETPAATVERLHNALLGVMRDADSLSSEARYERLAPALNAAYDFRTMTKMATGSAWTGASATQRTALVDAFTRLSIATYADRFSGFSGERFEIVGERPGPRDTVLVDTRIVRPADPPVPITYVLRQRQGQTGAWGIIDVLLQGSISELAVRRSEYAQILREGGVERLSAVLDAKASALLEG